MRCMKFMPLYISQALTKDFGNKFYNSLFESLLVVYYKNNRQHVSF